MYHTNRWTAGRLLGFILLTLGLGGLSGCSDLYFNDDPFENYRARRDGITFAAGNAVAHNAAVQTIDPWPRTARNSSIDVDGERLLIAGRRYQADKVKEPHGLETSTIVNNRN